MNAKSFVLYATKLTIWSSIVSNICYKIVTSNRKANLRVEDFVDTKSTFWSSILTNVCYNFQWPELLKLVWNADEHHERAASGPSGPSYEPNHNLAHSARSLTSRSSEYSYEPSGPGPWLGSFEIARSLLGSLGSLGSMPTLSARAIYFTSIVNNAIVTWRLLLYIIASLFNMIISSCWATSVDITRPICI